MLCYMSFAIQIMLYSQLYHDDQSLLRVIYITNYTDWIWKWNCKYRPLTGKKLLLTGSFKL